MAAATYAEVVLGDRPGQVVLSFGRRPHWTDNGRYRHAEFTDGVAYAWPAERDKLHTDVAREVATGEAVDIYVTPAVRHANATGRRKGDALPPMVCWVDLDGPPTDPALWNTLGAYTVSSGQPGHVHAYLPLTVPVDLARWRTLQIALRDALGGDDKISDNDLLRLPGTFNHKPATPRNGHPAGAPGLVAPQPWGGRVWCPEDLGELLGIDAASTAGTGRDTPTVEGEPVDLDDLPRLVKWALTAAQLADGRPRDADRSAATARLVWACRDGGLTQGQTVTVTATYPPAVGKYGHRVAAEVARLWAKKCEESENARKGSDQGEQRHREAGDKRGKGGTRPADAERVAAGHRGWSVRDGHRVRPG